MVLTFFAQAGLSSANKFLKHFHQSRNISFCMIATVTMFSTLFNELFFHIYRDVSLYYVCLDVVICCRFVVCRKWLIHWHCVWFLLWQWFQLDSINYVFTHIYVVVCCRFVVCGKWLIKKISESEKNTQTLKCFSSIICLFDSKIIW